MLLGCTILPRSGPTKSDVYQSSYGRVPIIPITPATAKMANLNTLYKWIAPSNTQAIDYETLDVDDKISINIWENTSEKLYTGAEQGPSDLGTIVITGSGTIYIPYLGTVKAAGNTIAQLQQKLKTRLKTKVINPQVIVKKVEGCSKKISIQGTVAKPGTFEITPGRHDLVSLLADAGGSTMPPELTVVDLERNGQQFKAKLLDVFTSPYKNIDLHPRDNLFLSEINQSFTSLGATGSQKLIKFPKSELTLIEAIALAEGLSDEKANPSHVFLLRYEKNTILNLLQPTTKRLMPGKYPVIYELNMRQVQSVFSAQQFKVRNADLIITTDAPYTNVRKMLSSLSPAIGIGSIMAP
jgi:polysaccharide export outer membrane protein